MAKFCFQCGKPLPGPVKFCPHCGALIAADKTVQPAPQPAVTPPPIDIAKPKPAPTPPPPPPAPPPAPAPAAPPVQDDAADPAAPSPSRAPWLVTITIVAVSLSGLTYVVLSSPNESADDAAMVEEPDPTIEQNFYAAADALIRARATKYDSPEKGTIPRGQQIKGYVETGVDGKSRWLRLSDGRGYVGMVNLTSAARPGLAFRLDNRKWFMEAANTLYETPSESGIVLSQLQSNEEVTLAGVTDNGFAEVKRTRGGVGYFPVRAQDDLGGYLHIKPKPVGVVSLANYNCIWGKDLGDLFAILDKRPATGGTAFGPLTRYMPVNLDHGGLHLAGLGSHANGKTLHFKANMGEAMNAFSKLGFQVTSQSPDYAEVLAADGMTSIGLFTANPENAQLGQVYAYCGF